MGVLEIRRSSVTRQNIDGLPRAMVDNGAVEAANIRARRSAEISGNINSALNGISSLVSSMAAFSKQQDQKKIDEAVRQYQQGMNAYNRGRSSGGESVNDTFDKMYRAGVGQYNNGEQGAMRMTIDDPEKWKADNIKFRDDFSAKLKDDLGLTDYQYEEAKKRLVGFDLTTQNQWLDRAETVDISRQLGTATENMTTSNATVADPHAAPETWIDWNDSVNSLIAANERKERRAFSDEEKQGMRRSQALVAFKAMVDNQSAFVTQQAMADGTDAEKVFDDAIKNVKGVDKNGNEDITSFLPETTWIVEPKSGRRYNIMGDALKGADMKDLKTMTVNSLERAKTSAIARKSAAQNEMWKTARNEALTQEREFLKVEIPPAPKEQEAYYKDLALKYETLAENENLSPQDRLEYMKTAKRMRSTGIEIENNEEFNKDMKNFNQGFIYDENFNPVNIDSTYIAKIARKKFADGKYTRTQFTTAMAIQDRKWDAESIAIRDHVIEMSKKIAPYAIYSKENNQFEFNGDKKTTIGSKSGVEFVVAKRKTQEATYAELIRVMNQVLDSRMLRNKTVEEACKEFDDRVKGTYYSQIQENIGENIKYGQKFNNVFR